MMLPNLKPYFCMLHQQPHGVSDPEHYFSKAIYEMFSYNHQGEEYKCQRQKCAT